MSDVTCIGMDAMGTALAQMLVAGGQTVTLWDHSTEPGLVPGTIVANSLADAIEASPVVLFCFADVAALHDLLKTDNLSELLKGKVVLQFSGGSAADVKGFAELVKNSGATMIEGAKLDGMKEL
jgi:3-hydroxyisobutyrate dehydrogenase-like beta-hydroxyacid dehydrogenase